MWDLIVSVPDHCLSFYLAFLMRRLQCAYQNLPLSLMKRLNQTESVVSNFISKGSRLRLFSIMKDH